MGKCVYSFLYVKKLNIMRFVTDRMLGKLSRWLRLFGYDTLEIKKQENEDDALLALAEKEGRILVSRDRALVRKAIKRGIRTYSVQSPEIMEQLREMQEEFGISTEPPLDRCTLCNSVIRKVKPEEMEIVRAKDYVYPDRLGEGTDFWLCDNCGQVYWQGKHWENITERAGRLKK
jgi:uncharacterized protein with PIN domain